MSHCDIEHHAVLYGLLARETIRRFGTDGEAAVEAAVSLYGLERGKRMAARAVERGEFPSPAHYQAYGERSSRPGQMVSEIASMTPEYVIRITRCAWCEAWSRYGLLPYGRFYCNVIDKSLARGFSPEYELLIPRLLSKGDSCCEFHWGFSMEEETRAGLAAKKEELGNSCVKDYDFHTGHLLDTMGGALVERFRDAGLEILQTAVAEFCRLFGGECLAAVAEAYPQRISPLRLSEKAV